MMVAKLREAPHAVAKFVARGLPLEEVSELTGHSVERLQMLRRDPDFCALVSFYRRRAGGASDGDRLMESIRDVVRAA